MDAKVFKDLLTPHGVEALAAAVKLHPVETNFLRDFTTLSRTYPREIARAALEIAILRVQARSKFEDADTLYFTREALEQASAAEVSTYRARRYRPFGTAADLGCSVGPDTMALAGVVPTLGIDLDELRLHMASANAMAAGVEKNVGFVRADLKKSLPLSGGGGTALFFDPSRRSNEKRAVSVKHYTPPLGVIREWLPVFPDLGVKISPAVKLNELTEYEVDYEPELEFISLRGELKEAVLWFGALRKTTDPSGEITQRRATILPGPQTLCAGVSSRVSYLTHTSPPRAYLYEPDPAVLRAGLVRALAAGLGAAQLDVDIAFLTADKRIGTPFARSWVVEDWMPFGLKRLRAYLRGRNVGRVTVKKRGSPIEVAALTRKLRLEGDEEKLVVLTHLEGKPIAIICSS